MGPGGRGGDGRGPDAHGPASAQDAAPSAPRAADIPFPADEAGRSGLDLLRDVAAGRRPGAPIAATMGFALLAVEDGRVTFEGASRPDHANPFGATHGGWYGVLLDSCMGCAVMSRLPAGRGYVTLEYKVNLVRALPFGTRVLATGIADHAGRTTAVAHGEIRGAEDGRLYATGTTTCLVFPARTAPA